MNYYSLDQESIALYSDVIPNRRVHGTELTVENIPRLYTYLVKDAKKAVLIIPGGGYARVALQHEGGDIAQRFQKMGYQAFVLYYRLPKEELWENAAFVPLQDAQRALHLIREHYAPEFLGVVGFSAGGHVAATLVNHDAIPADDKRDKLPLKPDFSVLVYPVITMKAPFAHKGTVQNLLGEHPLAENITYFSLTEHVTSKTPATFLVHAKDDSAVSINHSLVYRERLQEAGVLHGSFFYETGGHGFGLVNKTDSRLWDEQLFAWLDTIT